MVYSIIVSDKETKFKSFASTVNYLASFRKNKKTGNYQMGLPVFTVKKNGEELSKNDLAFLRKEVWRKLAVTN